MTPARSRSTRAPVMIRPDRGGWWAMIMLLGFLAVGLAALLFSYFHLLINAEQWPPQGVETPRFVAAAWGGGAMLAATLAVYAGVVQGVRGRRARLKIGLAAGFVLGIAALVVSLLDLGHVPFTAQTNVYGSLFFALAGYIAVLLMAGLVMLALVQFWVWLGFFGPSESIALVNVTLYLAFVAAAWIPVFASLYLAPYVLGGA
ncbi:MAG TPA: cytochrome c oxidase subunit 3 [Actinomycetota bacterium]|nr:cytochrome c oxidase subunit 3 [Actinomycetota bacterium]